VSLSGIKFQVIAKLNDLNIKFCDHDNDIAEMTVKGQSVQAFILNTLR